VAVRAYQEMQGVGERDLVASALADHDSAVEYVVGQRSELGLAMWASLQAAEKMVKAVTLYRGGSPSKHHHLRKLAKEAKIEGILDDRLLALVQCSAGVRYSPPKISIGEAVDSHLASLELSRLCASELSKGPTA
jgi:hypothetical protein